MLDAADKYERETLGFPETWYVASNLITPETYLANGPSPPLRWSHRRRVEPLSLGHLSPPTGEKG